MAAKPEYDNILKCGICSELLDIPKSLPCLHIFCQSCLGQHISSIVQESEEKKSNLKEFMCPVCTTVVPFPKRVSVETFVSQLPTSGTIEALIMSSKIKSGASICGPCQENNTEQKAAAFCVNCKKVLCVQCHMVHKRNKTSKSHTVLDIDDMIKEDPPIFTCNYCQEHKDQQLNNFCYNHQLPCCHSCVMAYHRQCDHVITLEEAAEGVKDSKDVTDLLQDMDDINVMADEIVTDQENIQKRLETDKQTFMKKIDSLCDDINKHLDDLESEFEKTFTTQHETHINDIKDEVNTQKIVNTDQFLRSVLNYCKERNVLPEKEIIQSQIKELEDMVAVSKANSQKLRYDLILTPELVNLTSSIQSLGAVKSVKIYAAQQTVGKFLTHISLRDCSIHKITTFHTDKCDTGSVHGVELLTDGRVLLTSNRNKAIYQFDTDGVLQKEFKLPGNPVDVAVINHTEAAVSYLFPRGICIVDTNTMSMSDQQNIMKERRYNIHGITTMRDYLVVACYDMIVVMNRDGTVLNEVKTPPPDDWRYITVVSDTRLCYTNIRQHSVHCIDLDGTEVFTYKHQDLKSPHGVSSDNEGVIYVAGRESNNVHQISPDGHLIKILLSGIYSPSAIFFDRANNDLLLTHAGSEVTRHSGSEVTRYHLSE